MTDIDAIPVLTRKVEPALTPAASDGHTLPTLVLTTEVSALVSQALTQQLPVMLSTAKQQFAAEASATQQHLLAETRTQIGNTIEAIEDVFRQAMETVGQQQLLKLEQRIQTVLATRESEMQHTMQQIHETLFGAVSAYAAQLRAEAQQALLEHQQQWIQRLAQAQETQLTQAFAEYTASQTAQWQQQLQEVWSDTQQQWQAQLRQQVQSELATLQASQAQQMQEMLQALLPQVRLQWATDASTSITHA